MGFHICRRLQTHIRQFVGRVAAVPRPTAHGQILEGVVAGEEFGGVAGNGPNPLRQFDPQRLDQFLGLFPGQKALLDVGGEIRMHVLVEPAQVQGQRILGQNGSQLGEPHHLDGLIKGCRRLFRHSAAISGDRQQFRLAAGILLRPRQLFRLLGIAVRQRDNSFRNQHRCPVKIDLLHRFDGDRLQLRQMRQRLRLEPAETFLEDNVLIVGGDFADRIAPLGIVVDDAGIHQDIGGFRIQP